MHILATSTQNALLIFTFTRLPREAQACPEDLTGTTIDSRPSSLRILSIPLSTYNTEQHIKYAIDANGRIAVGNDILSMDLHDNYTKRSSDLVRRNGFLYNKMTHTDVFTQDLELDVVRLYNFEDLPIPFRRYITYRASRVAATKLVANPQLVKLLAQQEALSRATLMEYECNQSDHSMFGLQEGSTYQTYQPWTNLRR